MGLDFLILYEHIVREYESALLLKAELERRGYTAKIRQLLDTKNFNYFTYKKPKVLVASAMYDNETVNSFVYNNVGRLNKVVNLHWEQVLSGEQEISPFFNCQGAAALCLHTCWGDAAQQRLIGYGVNEKNTVVTGNITLDFLRPEFAGYYKNKAQLAKEFNLDENKKFMLYISSFSLAYMSKAEVDELSKLAGVSFDAFQVTNFKSMNETLAWFARFLDEHDDIELIYRRHPSEWNSPALDEMAAKYKNFHTITAYSVKQWITACDFIFTWLSTAIAEVYFANKSCGVLRPFPIEWEYDPVTYLGCKAASTYDEFLQQTNIMLSGAQPEFPIDPALMAQHYSFTIYPSYKRIADALEQVYKNEPISKPFEFPGYKPRFSWVKYFSLIGLHVMAAINLDPAKFKAVSPKLAEWAGRIYGHIKKTRVPKAEAAAWQKRIETYMRNFDGPK